MVSGSEHTIRKTNYHQSPMTARPHLLLAILTCLCSNCSLGIVAIVFSCMSRADIKRGDTCKTLCWLLLCVKCMEWTGRRSRLCHGRTALYFCAILFREYDSVVQGLVLEALVSRVNAAGWIWSPSFISSSSSWQLNSTKRIRHKLKVVFTWLQPYSLLTSIMNFNRWPWGSQTLGENGQGLRTGSHDYWYHDDNLHYCLLLCRLGLFNKIYQFVHTAVSTALLAAKHLSQK